MADDRITYEQWMASNSVSLPEEQLKLIGQRIRARRGDLDMTLEMLASASGVSIHAIVNYEMGARVPKYATVLTLAAALGITPRYLFEGVA